MSHSNKSFCLFLKQQDRFQWPNQRRHPNQIWILFLLECPPHTQSFRNIRHAINWTATYRSDSDIVAPYAKYISLPTTSHELQFRSNFSSDKLRGNKVAWFVSNCGARNMRLEYARELGKYMDVDIFGMWVAYCDMFMFMWHFLFLTSSCGTKRCPRIRQKECFSFLNTTYKYYLAFENSNCRDYMTEKFFLNGLMNNILPIVMGSHPDDYRKSAPHNSFIHVDDFASPKDLAHFLLHMDDEKYQSYFEWKNNAHSINTFFWCRLCALLHSPRAERESRSYADLHAWWSGQNNDVCQPAGWRGIKHTKHHHIKHH